MGMDAYAVAAWGLRTTWGKIQATFKTTEEWTGPPDGDRSNRFDPKTGAQLYQTVTHRPEAFGDEDGEHAKYIMCNLERSYGRDRNAGDEWIIALKRESSGSHRSNRLPLFHAPKPPTEAERDAFIKDMETLGLWSPDAYGLWVYLDVSV